DPALVEAHRRRIAGMADTVKPPPEIALHVDPSIAQLDTTMIDQRGAIGEPREVERPQDVGEALRDDCTPQALLRDLHRPERYFDREFQRVDLMELYRIDVAASIDEIMATPTRVSLPQASPYGEANALVQQARTERKQPWTNIDTPRR